MHDNTATETTTNNIPKLKELYIANLSNVKETSELLKPVEEELAEIIRHISEDHRKKHAELYELAERCNEQLAWSETHLRESVVAHFEATGEKTIDENLSVRVNSRLEYENDDAVEWAEKNAPVMIYKTVDKKAFEGFATQSGIDLPFVRKINTPSAVIKGLK